MGDMASMPKYNEKKTTQAASILLKLNQGSMNYMKLIKLLYNIDREALKRFARPITFDDFYSLPHGQVISKTMNKIRYPSEAKTFWDQHILTKGRFVVLISDCDDDELSRSQIDLIVEMYEKYKNKNQFDMKAEHHNPDLFPEYKDPGGSSIKTDYEMLLQYLGFTGEQIQEYAGDMKENAILESLV